MYQIQVFDGRAWQDELLVASVAIAQRFIDAASWRDGLPRKWFLAQSYHGRRRTAFIDNPLRLDPQSTFLRARDRYQGRYGKGPNP